MARVKFRIRWYLPLALCLLLLPFVIERTVGYYTDGDTLKALEEEVADSLRSVLWEEPRLVEGGVSGPESFDYEPRVDPFGEILVFTRDLPGRNADLWVSRKERGRWLEPAPFVAVNSEASELGASFSPDGSLLYFYSDRKGGLGGYDIWVSELTEDGWALPRNLGSAVNSSWNEMNPASHPGGKAVYFVSDRRPGESEPPLWKSTVRSNLRVADWDLYVAELEEREDGEAVILPDGEEAAVVQEEAANDETGEEDSGVAETPAGEDTPLAAEEKAAAVVFGAARPVTELNTRGYAEGTPEVSPLGDFLYFSSNRPGGQGGFDLYRARLTPAGIEPPLSLGPQVNTGLDELDPSVALRGYELYFSREVNGQADIFVTLSREVRHVTESDGPYLSVSGILDWLASLIRGTPPWAISLLLALLVCAILLLLFRRYILSPTVLSACFLIAFLFHVMTGFWMNRTKVQRLLLEVMEEEEYEAFEVALESIPEEVISLEIREASAETKQDEAPALSAQLANRQPPRPRPSLEKPAMEAPASERPDTEILPFSETVLQREAIQAESSESLSQDLAFPEEKREALTPEIMKRELDRPEELVEEERELVSDLKIREIVRVEVELPSVALPTREPVEVPELDDRERVETEAPVFQAAKPEQQKIENPEADRNEKEETESRVELAARELTPQEQAKAASSTIEVAREVKRATPDSADPVERVDASVEVERVSPEAPRDAPERTELSSVEQVDARAPQKQVPTVENAPQRVAESARQPDVQARTLQRPEPVEDARKKESLAIESAQPVSRRPESEPESVSRPEVELNASPAAPPVEGANSEQPPAVATVGKASAAVDSSKPVPDAPAASKKVAVESEAPDVSRKRIEAPAESNPESGTPSLEVARQASRSASDISQKVNPETVAVEVQKPTPVSGTADAARDAKLPDVGSAEAPRTAAEREVVSQRAPERSESAGEEPAIARRANLNAEKTEEAVARKVLPLKQTGPVSRSRKTAEPIKTAGAAVEVSSAKPAAPASEGAGPRRLAVATASRAAAAGETDPGIEKPSLSAEKPDGTDAPQLARRSTAVPRPEASSQAESRELVVASARLARAKVSQAVVGKPTSQEKVDLQRSSPGQETIREKDAPSVSSAARVATVNKPQGETLPQAAPGSKADGAVAPEVEERAVAESAGPAPAKAPPKPAQLAGSGRLGARKSTPGRPKLSSPSKLSGLSRLRRPRSTFQGNQGRSPEKQLVARPQRVGPISSEETELESIAKVTKSNGDSAYLPKIYQLRGAERREEALMKGGGTTQTEAAVAAGLRWLALHQSPDGQWTLDHYADHLKNPSPRDFQGLKWNGSPGKNYKGGGYNYKGSNSGTVATAMALLAFFGHGESHLKPGPYRSAIDRGLKWLVKAQKPDGDLRGGGNLYMHGIAAFALTEAYAFTRDAALKEAAQRAIDFTVKAQVPSRGGWRYEPYPKSQDVDTSVFGWMMMALKSGKLGGLKVEKSCLSRAAMYLENARMPGNRIGQYAYQPGGSRTTHAMTAQGFFCQKMLSDTLDLNKGRNAAQTRRFNDASMKYFMANLPKAGDMNGVNFYYWYYATHALFQQGGAAWRAWNQRLTEVLLAHQVGREHGTAYGSWDPRGKRAEQAGRLYSTVLSILCLEVYYRYAPLTSPTRPRAGVRTEPRELEGNVNKPPPYPQRGQNARQEFDGRSVLLQIEVLADGTTGEIRTLEGIGGDGIDLKVARGVERSVIKAVKKWRWHPGKLDGVAVSASIRHRVKFELPALDD